jgi:two-component system cell cycle response regulator
MSRLRVLVADDEPAVLESVTWLLQEHGFEVTGARTGAECLAALEQRRPDLLVLDLALPDVEGYTLLERVAADPRGVDVPVLVLSALPPEEAAVRALGLGAVDFVRKPFRPRELVARVHAHLRHGALVRSTRDALQRAESALAQAQEDAESRRKLVDILHEVTGDLSVTELYQLLVGRAARALAVSHCSVILAAPGARTAQVVAAVENPKVHNLEVQLERYPELQAAFDTGQPVLVEDVASHPLYEGVRHVWDLEGLRVEIRSVIALPFTVDRAAYGVFLVRRTLDQPPFGPADLEFAQAVVTAAVAVIQRARMVEHTMADNARLEQLAQTDPLTQLLNRRALSERITAEMERALRYDSSLALLMVDLDHFKSVNDTWGHLVGDDVLRDMAALLRELVRENDLVARYGGEEFVIMLPETDDAGADGFAERVRASVKAHPFAARPGEEPIRLTTSIGVATFPAARIETVEDLFAFADAALYRAKTDGRDRVRR